jgi:competence protein ComEC
VNAATIRRSPHALALALCMGLSWANVVRIAPVTALVAVAAVCSAGVVLPERTRLAAVAVAVATIGWGWASERLDLLDRSLLSGEIGRAQRVRLVVTAPARSGRYDVRVPATVVAWGRRRLHERVFLKLPRGRAPPQGAILELVGTVTAPPDDSSGSGFDERKWLRQHGVHVVVRGSAFRIVGRRGGLGGLADHFRRHLRRSVAVGLRGDRKALLEGVVLGDDDELSQALRDDFRASGLYHLLAVSGQNVALVAGGTLAVGWLLGIARLAAELGALAAIAAYVLAVGAQPSVVRAGLAGALGSLAWLTARSRDRWYFLLLGAIALLGWNPYTVLDPGFELSFAAVASIFVVAPRLKRWLDGYPLTNGLRDIVAVSAACGLATAPVAWIHFHALALLTVPANAVAAPAVVPLLGLALAAAAIAPVSAGAAAALAWLNGWCAAYLAWCARAVAAVPGAQIRSTRALLVVLAGALLVAAYAWPRWRTSSTPST